MADKDKKQSTIDLIVKWCNKVDKSGEAGSRYKRLLSEMNDKQFEEFMLSLKNGEDVLYVNAPNLTKHGITLENNFKVAKELGVEFFKRLRVVDPKTGKRFLTPKKYAILDLPVRRQIQTIKSGLAYAKDENRIDPTTGQVVGATKAASLSTPETFILYSKGLTKSITEMLKVRGGDQEAQCYAYNKLQQEGVFNLEEVEHLGTRATSTITLNNLLKAVHIDNNI